mgnify:CR=1 FL=1
MIRVDNNEPTLGATKMATKQIWIQTVNSEGYVEMSKGLSIPEGTAMIVIQTPTEMGSANGHGNRTVFGTLDPGRDGTDEEVDTVSDISEIATLNIEAEFRALDLKALDLSSLEL